MAQRISCKLRPDRLCFMRLPVSWWNVLISSEGNMLLANDAQVTVLFVASGCSQH
jgi:hypothetical protein